MKLSDHTNHIRQTIQQAVENRLGRLGITINENIEAILSPEQKNEKLRFLEVLSSLKEETNSRTKGFEKLVDELTFTLFNRIAALKVAEAHTLIPEVITQRPENGNRSFEHSAFLESHPEKRSEEQEGLVDFIKEAFDLQANHLPLFSLEHYYHLIPTALELKGIIDAFNAVEKDEKDIDPYIWQSDDILGWLYESYNNYKKQAHKDSKAKTEYDKVSIQSQWYTPKWVVKFLVDNSLGKQYLEMYPHSEIKNKYAIANTPTECVREAKDLKEIKLIDPAMGSGNFLLYAFDVFYDLYLDQIDNYGADYEERDIPKLIIENNLYGVDLDNRAAQMAQLGLYIKARRKKRNLTINHFNLVSSDFVLPTYDQVKYIFNPNGELKKELEQVVIGLWDDLRQAHKFGALIRIEEIVESRLSALEKENTFNLFSAETLGSYQVFRTSFISDLQQAVAKHATSDTHNFMDVQAENAVTYLDVLTTKYDVAVANPPYTDSADFGKELKEFIEKHYKKPYKFHTNLYATFIKRCCELTTDDGKVAMIHPHTFMFIKTFEDVRKYLLSHTHIDLLVDHGLDRANLFDTTVRLDATYYVLSKKIKTEKSIFIKIGDSFQERDKKSLFLQAYKDLYSGKTNKLIIPLRQEKLKIIEGWPFIYWISDGFREKFIGESFDTVSDIKVGINSGSNEQYVRFWWEIDESCFSEDYSEDKKKWVGYAKGGPFNKWYGNLWLKLNWENNGNELRNCDKAILRNEEFYFKEGITYSASGSKGVSFRYLPSNYIFDVGGSCIFPKENISNKTLLSILNSTLSFYIADCLNPTVNTQVGDLKRIPLVEFSAISEKTISALADKNIETKKKLCSYRITEINFQITPLTAFQGVSFKDRVLEYLNDENAQATQVLINEAIINELIFEVYELSYADREQVEAKMGYSIGSLPVFAAAKNDFLILLENQMVEAVDYIQNLEEITFDQEFINKIKEGFTTLYQSNNDLEEFCIRHQVNPINVWYWFKETYILPVGRAKEIALEFVTDHIRTLLTQDDDGIIPLYQQALETRLLDRLVAHLHQLGFSAKQIAELDQLLGKPLEKYIDENLFNDLANHLNLFMYLPKTPFIWHLSSGNYKTFEVYVSIYQWNRDSIFKLKSVYLAKRREQLQMRQSDIREAETAAAQAEKELIVNQLTELDSFETKLDELIAENYTPILDSGVAKNIAPLQKKGMLKAEVLKAPQLTKYLNADW